MNACIIGYGAIGPVHAHVINKLQSATLYGVCDINLEQARKCADEYGCKIYRNIDEVLQDDKIDVVHICTPHYLHKKMALRCLRAGKNVVLEKPVAISMGDLDELVDFLDGNLNQNKLCVILQNRRNACIEKLKEIMADKEYTGKLKGVIGNVYWKRDEAYYAKDEWRGKWATEGGGLLINQAIHMLDMMLYFGGNVKLIKSHIAHWEVSNIEVEDNAMAVIQFESGAKGIFQATNCYVTDEPYNMELLFEKVHFRYADGCLYQILEDNIKIIAKDDRVQIGKGYWGTGHEMVISGFYNSLQGNEGSYTDIHDAYAVMKLVFDIYNEGELDEGIR